MNGEEVLPLPRAAAFAALNDVDMLKAAIKGCESLTPVGENEFEALCSLSMGPLKASFKGRLHLTDLQPPLSYRIVFEGDGGMTGHARGQALVRLEEQGEAETLLHYEVQASVGGKIAQIGARLVDMGARKIAADFFKAFKARLTGASPIAPDPPAE